MATTITAADAIVTLTVALTLGDKPFDIEFSKTLGSATQALREVISIPTSEVDLFGLTGAAVDKGSFTDFNGFFIMNRDDTNFVRLRWLETGGDTVDFKLEPGDFMILWNSIIEVKTTGAAFAAFVQLDTVAVQADTAAVDVEFLAVQI